MLFAQLTPTRDSTSELLDAPRQREVGVFGHSTPGKTRTPNEGNGTPKRNIFLPRGESRIAPEQQKEQHSTIYILYILSEFRGYLGVNRVRFSNRLDLHMHYCATVSASNF